MIGTKRHKYLTIPLFLLLFTGTTFAVQSGDMSEEAISERIAPIGTVRLGGSEASAVQAVPVALRTAETIYNTFCTVCHASGIAGAPITGDKAAWKLRLAKGREMVNSHAIQGFNAMPMRGTCMDCSDEDIIKTIDYILSK